MTDLQGYFDAVLKLKEVRRAGWAAKAGIKSPESVADHTFSMCAICMVLSDMKGLQTERVLKMAILHDLAESIVGDYMPGQITAKRKIEEEKKAMKEILSCIPAKTRKQYENAWLEYLRNNTEEARFVHRIDKLEMAIQAAHYGKRGRNKKELEQFLFSAQRAIVNENDIVTRILKSLMPATCKEN